VSSWPCTGSRCLVPSSTLDAHPEGISLHACNNTTLPHQHRPSTKHPLWLTHVVYPAVHRCCAWPWCRSCCSRPKQHHHKRAPQRQGMQSVAMQSQVQQQQQEQQQEQYTVHQKQQHPRQLLLQQQGLS
jgi:hypothetical protein